MKGLSERLPDDYAALLAEVKERVYSAQYEALKAVNRELVALYWDIGKLIAGRQEREGWGRSVVERLADDLQNEFPGVRGFSVQNLCICGTFTCSIVEKRNSNRWFEKSS